MQVSVDSATKVQFIGSFLERGVLAVTHLADDAFYHCVARVQALQSSKSRPQRFLRILSGVGINAPYLPLSHPSTALPALEGYCYHMD